MVGGRNKTRQQRQRANRALNRRRSAEARAMTTDQPVGTKDRTTTWRRPDGSTYETMSLPEVRHQTARAEAAQRHTPPSKAWYATSNPYGVTTVNRNGAQGNHLYVFGHKLARDLYVSADPTHREPIPANSPLVRRLMRLVRARAIQPESPLDRNPDAHGAEAAAVAVIGPYHDP